MLVALHQKQGVLLFGALCQTPSVLLVVELHQKMVARMLEALHQTQEVPLLVAGLLLLNDIKCTGY